MTHTVPTLRSSDQRDARYLVIGQELHTWYTGAPLGYVWRSMRFTLPRPTSFGWGQVQAEAYPVTLKVYEGNVLLHTQIATSRLPFRLPPGLHDDIEFEVSGNTAVFSVALEQSMEELKNV